MLKDFWALLVVLLLVGALIVITWFYMSDRNNGEEKSDVLPDVKSAVLKTNQGDIEIEFFREQAPATVDNFVTLSEAGFYNGTKFHRVIKEFMIQGGDPLTKEPDKSVYGFGGPGYKFNDEANSITLEKGVVAMANSGPNTNGSQFFIITATSTPWLQGKHTAFARVVSGMDVVDKIENMPVDERDIPLEDVVVKSVELK